MCKYARRAIRFDTLKHKGCETIAHGLHSQARALLRSGQSLRLMSEVDELLLTSRQATTFLQTSERCLWLHTLTNEV